MIVSVLLSISLTVAEPPKPVVSDGRITFWADGCFVHMNPDGTNWNGVALPEDLKFKSRFGVSLSSDEKYAAEWQMTKSFGADAFQAKLVVHPLQGQDKSFPLDGYVPRAIISFVGTSVYFIGVKADVWNQETSPSRALWSFDVLTKKVTKHSLRDDQIPFAISANGKQFMIERSISKENIRSPQCYLVDSEGNHPTAVLGPNLHVGPIAFSPLGDRFIAQTAEYEKFVDDGRGTIEAHNLVKEEMVVYDLAKKKMTPLTDTPAAEYLCGIQWNPAGTKIAYVRRQYTGENPNGRVIPPKAALYDYKVFVAEPDGSNAKVVYTTTSGYFRAFQWQK